MGWFVVGFGWGGSWLRPLDDKCDVVSRVLRSDFVQLQVFSSSPRQHKDLCNILALDKRLRDSTEKSLLLLFFRKEGLALLRVQHPRIDHRPRKFHRRAVAPGGVEAGAAAGVAGDADLVDEEEDGVGVAIVAQVDEALRLAGSFAFAPEAAARAAIVAGLAGGEGFGQGFGVHPGEHEDFAGIVLLGDGGDEAGGGEGDGGHGWVFRGRRKASRLFSRKRTKKLLSVRLHACVVRSARGAVQVGRIKAFWSFFSKKDCLPRFDPSDNRIDDCCVCGMY